MAVMTSEAAVTLGESARKVRLALNLTQQELATLTGISRDSVYQFEHNLPVILDARRRILKELWAIKATRTAIN
jgi:transcriptional regulator with XRE-family HTH domain